MAAEAPSAENGHTIFTRQTAIFDPDRHRERLGRIGLVGCGAIGSAVALVLMKMGVEGFDVWDYDNVEVHNVPNQVLYNTAQDGWLKVQAARSSLAALTSHSTFGLRTHAQRFPVAAVRDYDTLILATDTLGSRRGVWHMCLRTPRPERVLDLRMGGQTACRYALTRNDGVWDTHITAEYEKLLVEGSGDHDLCGARSFLPTALMCASLAGLTLAAWARGESVPWEVYVSHESAVEPYLARR